LILNPSNRYSLLDYFYTAFHQASLDGSPVLNPLGFKYPTDTSTFGIDLQYFFGDSILVSPVTEENATSVSIYLPKDQFYDFATLKPVVGTGQYVTLTNISLTMIPLHIRGGAVLPLRANGTMTTTELRATDFEFLVAPDANGTATGSLYVDDGVSIVQNQTTNVEMAFANGTLSVNGSFGYEVGTKVASVVLLGVGNAPTNVTVSDGTTGGAREVQFTYDDSNEVVRAEIDTPLTSGFEVVFH
jgi:alpha-glucosidase